MQSFLFRLSFIALGLVQGAAAAEWSLADIAGRVRTHHPDLRAARLAIDEARGRQIGSGRLANPSIGVEWQNESQLSPGAAVLSFDQAFPITRKLSIEKALTARLIEAAEYEVADGERRFIAEARSLAVKLLAIGEQRGLRERQIALSRELSDFAKGRAEAGEISPLDAAQAQLDAQRLLLESRRLENEGMALAGELKPMLGLAPETELVIRGDLSVKEKPEGEDWKTRPDYLAAQTKIEAAETAVDLALAHRRPDVTAGLFAGRESQDVAGGGSEDSDFVGFRLSIPLPFWNRNQGEIAEKTAGAERARLESEALALRIAGEADTARREMVAHAALAAETREKLLPLIIEQTDKLEKAYAAGQTDLITVLRAREQRLQFEAAALDASRDYHLARVRYEAAIGISPAVAGDSK